MVEKSRRVFYEKDAHYVRLWRLCLRVPFGR